MTWLIGERCTACKGFSRLLRISHCAATNDPQPVARIGLRFGASPVPTRKRLVRGAACCIAPKNSLQLPADRIRCILGVHPNLFFVSTERKTNLKLLLLFVGLTAFIGIVMLLTRVSTAAVPSS